MFATVCPPDCNSTINGNISQHYLTHPETFAPEYVDAYEIGTKNTVLEGRLTANLAAFYYDYKGYQISEIVDRAAINFNYDATVKGLELELDWRPLENLRLGFKGGYEDTRVANGMKAIDLMDRTAGKEGWMVFRPFPTLPSNCVVPTWLAAYAPYLGGQSICTAYLLGVDPATYLPYVPNPTVMQGAFGNGTEPFPPWWFPVSNYPGYDPASANNGEGFEKDLSGHELPNAPKYTATITADYTLPLANDWLVTLHADLYRQAEAWTRIFNDPGYDKLKAYSNVNLAAIFSNDDAGWQVMAYVKNVFDKDNITGAFLNSDDTGLTTNVFLNEPRLFGLRVTKNWTGGAGPFGSHTPGAPWPFTVELGAQMQRMDTPNQAIFPFDASFPKGLDPVHGQTADLDWTHSPEVKITYQPSGSAWNLAAAVRYGRTTNRTGPLRQEKVTGDAVCQWPTQGPVYSPYVPGLDLSFVGKLRCDPTYGPAVTPFGTFQNKYNPSFLLAPTDRLSSSTDRKEEHVIVDFAVGKDVGLGALSKGESSLSAGLRYADFKSATSGDVRAVPDMMLPEDYWAKYSTTFHQYIEEFDAHREFKGAGPTLSWDASRELFGNDQSGRVNLDWAVTGGLLFGRQKTTVTGSAGSNYFNGVYPSNGYILNDLAPPPQTPMNIAPRNKTATVPVLDLSLGLSYAMPGVKMSAGYRWERYFNVLDGGAERREGYDRTLDGPYVKIAVGFGG